MGKQSTEVTVEFLQAFADAWNRHDIDDLMSFMTDDCVFESSAGDEVCGTRYEGAEAVRAGFPRIGRLFQMPDGPMTAILWSVTEEYLNGRSRGLGLMVSA